MVATVSVNIYEWAMRWRIPVQAIKELELMTNPEGIGLPLNPKWDQSEASAERAVMLEAPRKDCQLWRNNVGVLEDERGVPVRYGLANRTKEENELLKSHDLIGLRRTSVADLYRRGVPYVGQFVSREMKPPGWKYTGKGREEAQHRFGLKVISMGGDAAFATGEGTL
jgi:hypothetical protein